MGRVNQFNYVESARVMFDYAGAVRVKYRESYDMLRKEYENRKKGLESEYRGKRLEAERENLRKEFDTQVSEMKSKAREVIGEQIKGLRDYEKSRVNCAIDREALNQLEAISKMPLSRMELDAITKKYGEKDNYWTNRMLLKLAEANGLDSPLEFISADDRMKILDEISNQLEMALQYTGVSLGKYNPDNTKINVALMPAVLDRAEALYLYGRRDTLTRDSAKVQKALELATVIGADSIVMAADKLEMCYKNMTNNARNHLLLKLATENTVKDAVINLCSFSGDVEAIKNEMIKRHGDGYNLIDEYHEAEAIGAEILNMDNVERMTKKISSHKSNRYLIPLLESMEADGNSVLSESLHRTSQLGDMNTRMVSETVSDMVNQREVVVDKTTMPEPHVIFEQTKLGEALESVAEN